MTHADITVSLGELPALPRLQALWQELERTAEGSFFTSWSWIGSWLSVVHAIWGEMPAELIVARCGSRVVGLAILCRGRKRRMLGGAAGVVYLNQTGHPDDRAAFIEYNGFLVEREIADVVRQALLDFIQKLSGGCRTEFWIAGADSATAEAVRSSGQKYRIVRRHHCPWIDLSTFLPTIDAYLATLSRNTRQQVQRAIRLAERDGPVTLAAACSPAEAIRFMEEMRGLHEQAWRRKGKLGAFASPYFARFITALLDAGSATGEVDVLRITASGATVGVLFNFVYHGQVYAYQSGFPYKADNRHKPGLVSHVLAAVHYRRRNLTGYHFMAGDGRYKASLAKATEELTWLTLMRGKRALSVAGLRTPASGAHLYEANPILKVEDHWNA